jgi:hypothetical protein
VSPPASFKSSISNKERAEFKVIESFFLRRNRPYLVLIIEENGTIRLKQRRKSDEYELASSRYYTTNEIGEPTRSRWDVLLAVYASATKANS